MNILVARCFCNACGHKADLDPGVFRKAAEKSRLRCSHCGSYDTGLRQCWMAPHELLPTNVVAFRKPPM